MSHLFLINLLLAAGFAVIMDQLNLGGLIAGFLIGYAALWITRSLFGATRYFMRVIKLIKLAGTFIWELVVSNFRVLWDVITPTHISRPAVIGVPLDAHSDFEIMVVANIISLTPGTLSLDVSEDRSTLYVHVMFVDDVETARAQIKERIEKHVLEAFR
ncbi:MAG: Na+/H+ antiporter subunit E [Desulfohalobiaceae bacterium]|nr:Na+/H+ antiporter subunit E [Desulfohalobiaceae bacterium]